MQTYADVARMQYEIVVERCSTGFGAYVPDLPGCVAVGESEAEVRALIREAIEFHLEAVRGDRDAAITAQLNRVYRDDPGGLDPALRRAQRRWLDTPS